MVGPWAGKKHSDHLTKESEMSCFHQKTTFCSVLGGHRMRPVMVGIATFSHHPGQHSHFENSENGGLCDATAKITMKKT